MEALNTVTQVYGNLTEIDTLLFPEHLSVSQKSLRRYRHHDHRIKQFPLNYATTAPTSNAYANQCL